MAPVVIPVAIAAAAGAAGVALGVTTVAAAAISVAATAAASYLTYSSAQKAGTASVPTIAPTPVGVKAEGNFAARGFEINDARPTAIRQPLPPRRFVYGRARVGGAVLFQDVNNPALLIMSAVSDGEIEGFVNAFLGEEVVTLDGSGDAVSGTRFYELVSFEFAEGDDAQAASALLAAEFGSLGASFRQRGIARAVARLEWGSDASVHNYVYGTGIEPAYLVDGVKVYDPRDDDQDPDDPSTWLFSSNPALCVAHAMTQAWQVGLPTSAVDWDAVAEAADDCDAVVTYGGQDRALFRCAGVVQSDSALAGQLSAMLTAFNGAVVFSNGKYGIKADKTRAPIWTVTDADILAIEDIAHDVPIENRFSAIKGVFYDADNLGRRTTTPVHEVTGETITRETAVDLPFTPDNHSAQILARRSLYLTREALPLTLRLHDPAAYLEPADVITIDSDALPVIDGQYQVMQVDLADRGVVVTLRKLVSAAYADPSAYLI